MTDQIDIDFEALGRIAAASPHFCWLPGMLTASGARCVSRPRADGRQRWLMSDSADGASGPLAWVGNIVDTPDLRDAATRGCLLDLVRAAWHDHSLTFVHDHLLGRDNPRWKPFTGSQLLTRLSRVGFASETEALVVALEAAAAHAANSSVTTTGKPTS